MNAPFLIPSLFPFLTLFGILLLFFIHFGVFLPFQFFQIIDNTSKMFLIPPDCSRSEAIARMANSLQILQQNSNQIFAKAAQRANQCQEKMNKLLARVEMLEAKMVVLDQMEQMPILHCAAKYPEVGTPGRQMPVFDRLNWQTSFWQSGDPFPAPNLPSIRPINLANDHQSVKDAFLRKQNIGPINEQKKESFNVEKLTKMLANSEDSKMQMNLAKLLEEINETKGESRATAQIDFSESLLDENSSPSHSPSFQIDPFEFEAEIIDELIEFDLPEDLPGIDARNLGSNTFQSEISISATKSNQSSKKEEKEIKNAAEEEGQNVGIGGILATIPAVDCAIPSPMPKMVQMPCSSTSIPPAPPPLAPPPPPPPLQLPSAKIQPSRADLMQAIRATGGMKGAGLKKVEKEKKMEEEKEAENSKKIGGGEEDLMSSLAKVLALRRKGISGKEKATTKSTGPNAALDKLRERIPIVKKGGGGMVSEEADDEEWDE